MHLSDDAFLLAALRSSFGNSTEMPIGVAVSGGGDSMALLHLMASWAGGTGALVKAVTVDHGLRPEAANEAREVGIICAGLGVPHTSLKWQDWDGSGNLQDQARRARYRLMADWADREGVGSIALGHTADDQAETFLMRLAREAGVDGLAGMQASRVAFGVAWHRPLLGVRRQSLREYLTRHQIRWFDDPSNEDLHYDRIKARKLLAALSPLGIDVDVLTAVAVQLSSAKAALQVQTVQAARSVATVDVGDVRFDRDGFAALPDEISRRLMVHALNWVATAEYAPRRSAVAAVMAAVLDGRDATLHGCRIMVGRSGFRVTRELRAVECERCETDQTWDGRWRATGALDPEYQVAALGVAGLAQCPDWREGGLPRASLLASPAIWSGKALIAAPQARFGSGWTIELLKGEDHFFKSIISH